MQFSPGQLSAAVRSRVSCVGPLRAQLGSSPDSRADFQSCSLLLCFLFCCVLPDNRYLLSVSRDRHVSLFEFRPSSDPGASVGAGAFVGSTKLKAHARIIWSCSWAPVRGAHYFATGSRDKSVKCFRVDAQGAPVEDACLPVFGAAVTAVAFAPMAPQRGDRLFPEAAELAAAAPRLTLAVGLEDGTIELWQSTTPLGSERLQWARLHSFHSKSVDAAAAATADK